MSGCATVKNRRPFPGSDKAPCTIGQFTTVSPFDGVQPEIPRQ